jgi:hypothetical protein
MRPAGPIRQALRAAFQHMTGAPSHLELAAVAGVPADRARQTLRDMARAGEVAKAGTVPSRGPRQANAYTPAPAGPAPECPLQAAMRGWRINPH